MNDCWYRSMYRIVVKPLENSIDDSDPAQNVDGIVDEKSLKPKSNDG